MIKVTYTRQDNTPGSSTPALSTHTRGFDLSLEAQAFVLFLIVKGYRKVRSSTRQLESYEFRLSAPIRTGNKKSFKL